jgi:hypothetical protein
VLAKAIGHVRSQTIRRFNTDSIADGCEPESKGVKLAIDRDSAD